MREIPLTKGAVALVDDEDYDRLCKWSWYLLSTGYAVRTQMVPVRRCVLMHREVLGFPDAQHVDHIDGDKLNNCKRNLRPCSASQNQGNRRPTSGRKFKGVTKRSGHRSWAAEIKVDGRSVHLGSFATEEAAARAYDRAALERHGTFARLNFPQERSTAA